MKMKKILGNLDLENLNPVVFKKVYYTLLDIESEVLIDSDGIIQPHKVIYLPLQFSNSEEPFLKDDPKRHRIDALVILCRHGIIRFHAFEHPFDSDRPPISNFPSGRIYIYVTHPAKFGELKEQMKAIYEKKFGATEGGKRNKVYPLESSDIRLDDDVALRSNFLLFRQASKDIFTQKVNIQPKAAKLIRYLFHRKDQRASLQELRGQMKFTHSNQIHGLKTHIIKVCRDNDVTKIIHNFKRGMWGLNPELTEIKKKINISAS